MIEENGIQRHILQAKELKDLYKRLDDFIADLTFAEYNENREAFTQIKTLIHQREREAEKNNN